MVLEFQRAERMGNALNGVRLSMREVIAGINRPGVPGARVVGMQNAVETRITQIDVAGRHVDLGAQHAGAVGKLAGAHTAEKVKVLFRSPVAEWAVAARLCQG